MSYWGQPYQQAGTLVPWVQFVIFVLVESHAAKLRDGPVTKSNGILYAESSQRAPRTGTGGAQGTISDRTATSLTGKSSPEGYSKRSRKGQLEG